LQKYQYRWRTNVNIWLVHKVKVGVSIYQLSLPCEYKRVKHKIKKCLNKYDTFQTKERQLFVHFALHVKFQTSYKKSTKV
jgi:hypothetical protein